MGIVNIEWRDAMADCGGSFNKDEQDNGWPESLKAGQIAHLQRWWKRGDFDGRRKYISLLSQITDECKTGIIQSEEHVNIIHSKTTYKKIYEPHLDEFMRTHFDVIKPCVSEEKIITWYTVTALAFKNWIESQRMTPSTHIQSWFNAQCQFPAIKDNNNKKGPTWKELALPYMRKVFEDGKYPTCWRLYEALIKEADKKESPFYTSMHAGERCLILKQTGKNFLPSLMQKEAWKLIKIKPK